MHESPKACFDISKVSLPVLPNRTQNLMHTLCSSTSAIPPISENRRRLMQYTRKDTYNNHTSTSNHATRHTHKTPPQHNLAGNFELQATCVIRTLSWDFWIHLRKSPNSSINSSLYYFRQFSFTLLPSCSLYTI